MFCAFKKIKYYFYFTLPKIALPPVADKSAVDFQVGRDYYCSLVGIDTLCN